MAEFRNTTGYPLVISDLAVTVDPGGEFEWPGYDPKVNGVVPGCTRLDDPAAEPAASTPPAGGNPASGTGQPGADAANAKAADPKTDSGSSSSKEN